MRLQAKLKLQLSKQRKTIEVKYNTFEKATYDKYLCASLALRSEGAEQAYKYIDDITGNGSLNSHFKTLYEEAKLLTKEQLEDIMKNSLYPILKTDASAWYDYFDQLDISLYKNKIYSGDIGEISMEQTAMLIGLDKEILEKRIIEKGISKKPEPYEVLFKDNNIQVKIGKEQWVGLTNDQFNEVLVKELDNIQKYNGEISDSPDGDGWSILNNSVINNLVNGRFYYKDGNHYQIRSSDVRETIVARIAGLYLYKQRTIIYRGNYHLCAYVIDFLLLTDEIKTFKPAEILAILEYCNDERKQKVINYFLFRAETKEYSELGIKLLISGLKKGWEKYSLKAFLKYAKAPMELEAIYQCDDSIGFDLKALVKIDIAILNENHRQMVEEYNANLERKREVIRNIIGDVTTKNLRERSKALKSDEDTKKFSKLCNELIGHGTEDINDLDEEDLLKLEKKAFELERLSKIIEEKLKVIE